MTSPDLRMGRKGGEGEKENYTRKKGVQVSLVLSYYLDYFRVGMKMDLEGEVII